MKYSRLAETNQSQNVIDVFGGYNHNIKIEENQFFDMKNMTSSSYPVLSPRKKRGYLELDESAEHHINGIIFKENLCYVDGTSFYIDGVKVEGLELEDSKKNLISMGAYVIIMPDKKYLNTKDLADFGDIEAHITTAGTVTYSIARIDGTEYENVTVSDTAPSDPKNMDYWIDTSSTPHTLKQYASTTAMWVAIATTYVRIAASGIASGLKQYDAVKISGIKESIEQLKDLEGQTSILWEVHEDTEGNGANDYIVVVGFLDEVTSQTEPLTLAREMPIMDFIVESNNRLWGCRYGTNLNGDVVNEIYASKLGDFKNWNCFMGITTDSYMASCGTDGAWTGAITHLGYPLFFKENVLHKVFGNYPSNYQIQSTPCRGVQKGSGDSLAIVNETLLYKSRNGICSYDGSLPQEISSAFGDVIYTDAAAGSHSNKYYISMKSSEDQQWHLFVFDAQYGLWHKEDETHITAFSSGDNELFFVTEDASGIHTMLGSGIEDKKKVDWMIETGVVGTYLSSKKYISQMLVRMSMELGASVMVYIQYDSCGEWEHITTMTGTSLRSFNLPIRPHRCDHFRVRLLGRGDAKIYSITENIERGSDM